MFANNKSRIAVGIDVGSAFTRCVIFQLDDGYLKYLAHSEIESTGWSKGRLVDHLAVQSSIRVAVEAAEDRANVSVDGVVMGIGGSCVEGANRWGLYEFARKRRITQDQVSFAVERVSKGRLDDDRMILEVLPQDFTLDGRGGYRHPVGSMCSRLEANVSSDHHLPAGTRHDARSRASLACGGGGNYFRADRRGVRVDSTEERRRRSGAGGHRMAFDRRCGLRWRRAGASKEPACRRRPLHARRGVRPEDRVRRCRAPEDRIRVRDSRSHRR